MNLYSKSPLNIVVTLIVATVFCFPIAAAAQGNIKLGRLEVVPSAKYKIEYDDNIFSNIEGADKTDDILHTFTIAVGLKYMKEADAPGPVMNFGAEVVPVVYSDNDENNYTKQKYSLEVGYLLPSSLYFGVTETYKDNEDPYGSERDTIADDEGIRTTGWDNEVAVDIKYGNKFEDRLFGGLAYKNQVSRFDRFEDAYKEEDVNSLELSSNWLLTPKTAFKFVLGWEGTEFPEQDSGDNDRGYTSSNSYNDEKYYGLIGVSFNPSGKLEGDILFGYGSLEYDNDIHISGLEYEDVDTWVARTGLTWKATERTKLRVKLERGVKSTDDPARNYYDDTNFGVGLDQGIIERLTLKLDLSYNYLDYNQLGPTTPEKTEDTITAGIGLDYKIKDWLSASLNFEGKRNNKEEGTTEEDTENNKISFEISATY